MSSTEKLISTIYEYQNYIKLNTRFIHELEAAGGDTSQLKTRLLSLNVKLLMKMTGGYLK
jgi:hypothetical protein